MIPELEIYLGTAIVMAVAGLGFAAWVATQPARRRRFLLPAVLICWFSAAAYAAMWQGILTFDSMGEEPVPAARFVEYVISFTIMMAYIGYVAGARRRTIAALLLINTWLLGSVAATWYLVEPLSYVSNVSAVIAFAVLCYVLVVPFGRAARERSGDRQLLFVKLRNLLLVLWIVMFALALSSRQGLGLVDAFVGIFIGVYIDVLLRISFGAILIRAGRTVDALPVVAGGSGGEDEAASADSTTQPDPAD